MSETKVALNLTLPALERLLGGDPVLELELKKQAVNEFARRYLKDVAETQTFQVALTEAKRLITKIAKEQCGIENLLQTELWPRMNERIEAMIKDIIRQKVDLAIETALREQAERQKRYWESYVNDAVKRTLDRQIEKEIQAGVQKRLQAALEAK